MMDWLGAGRSARRRCAAACLSTLLMGGPAHAGPQLSIGVDNGLGGRQLDGPWDESHWHVGAQAVLLLSKDRYSDVGVGPFARLHTATLRDTRLAAGLTLELPTPLVAFDLSAGPLLVVDGNGARGGAVVEVLVGLRGFNHDGLYAMSNGLYTSYGRTLDGEGSLLAFGLRLDLALGLVPLGFLVGLIRS